MAGTSSGTVVTVTPADRAAINEAFPTAHAAAARIVPRVMTMLLPGCDPAFGFTDQWNCSPQKALLDKVLATVPHIGTPAFEEVDYTTLLTGMHGYDVRADWPIVLFAHYAAWAHTSFTRPEEFTLADALGGMREHIVEGEHTTVLWTDEMISMTPTLQHEVCRELRENYKLVGPWHTRRIHRGHEALRPDMLVELRIPHCRDTFKATVHIKQSLHEGMWFLDGEYETFYENQAIELERQATAMVEAAVQASLPLRTQAARLRVKAAKK